ncbi:MAG: hypothetical protein N2Z80_03190 [Hydrogenothermaceae bacterium]|nr:hypothetical protein [Hydrogenothermaceae bacterium]
MNPEDLMKNPFMSNRKFNQTMEVLKEETEFERIVKLLAVPSKSGIYISKVDIRNIGLSIGVDVPVRERKEMLKDIFYYAKQIDKLKEFLDKLIEYVNYRISQYKQIQSEFPVSAYIFDEWIEKANKLISFIQEMKTEIDIYKV